MSAAPVSSHRTDGGPYSEPCLGQHVKWFVLANNTFLFISSSPLPFPSVISQKPDAPHGFWEEFLPAECRRFQANKNSYAL